jgi:DNA modification methylase
MSYDEFRKSIAGRIEEKLEWRDLATFVPNKKLPIYSWFYYKEGFAKELVEKLISMFEIREGATVLDPFCGSGTALLVCKEHKIKSVGYDVLPISVFASRVKTADYDVEKLREEAKKLSSARFYPVSFNFPNIFHRAFNRYALQDIAFLFEEIKKLDLHVREFFTLALINAAVKCSYAYKDGSMIKFKRRPVAPLRKMMRRSVARMIKDTEKAEMPETPVDIELNDARIIPLEDESIDAIITSPPYLNQIDYTKVYTIEEFFLHAEPIPGVRTYIGLKIKESNFLEEIDLPLQARLYFEDMNDVLKEMYRVLKKGSYAAVVVGNGYVDGIVESDLILAYLAEKSGFGVEKILVLNTRFALEDRTVKKGILRESLIILKK